MSHVGFKKWHGPLSIFCTFCVDFKTVKCCLLNIRKDSSHDGNIFLMSISAIFHVDFKKWLCRPVKFKGQESLCPLNNNTAHIPNVFFHPS